MEHRNRIIKNLVVAGLILFHSSSHTQGVQFADDAASNPQQQQIVNLTAENQHIQGRQSGRNLFDFVGLGTGNQIDPFLRKTNEKCLNGELAECFKSQALNTFDDFFKRDVYM